MERKMSVALIGIWLILIHVEGIPIYEIHDSECYVYNEWSLIRKSVLMLCPNRQACFAQQLVCDKSDDCGDNSDETFCEDKGPITCSKEKFQCASSTCIPKDWFCDGRNDCGDYSDEFYCKLRQFTRCPPRWFQCVDRRRCIQENWLCDGKCDCSDGSDEKNCTKSPKDAARDKGIAWLLNRKKIDSSTNKWGPQLHRIATALYLADESLFAPGNTVGEEMRYELTLQLLSKLTENSSMRSQELAAYIQALLVTCADPKDFHKHNLVSALRRRVEERDYSNPFEILVLCNSGDTMTDKDVERVTTAFDSKHRLFWTDKQAIASMALQCLASSSNVKVDERTVKSMQDQLKRRQFRNGTVDNPMTTALVIQALLSYESYKEFFNLEAATSVLLESQKEDGSWGTIQNTYYVLPVLGSKGLLNISSKHCSKLPESEEEITTKLQVQDARGVSVQYSVFFGNDMGLGQNWRVRMETSDNISYYDVIETVKKLDPRHAVKYNVINGKPYVSSLLEKENDPELDMYWFTYIRSTILPESARLVETSPVDAKILPDQELILWYKPGSWSEN